MPTPPLALLAASAAPVDATAGSITGYLLGFGPLGLFALVMGWLMFKGWRLMPPDREAGIRAAARDEARADLLKENERLAAKLDHAETQRDDALKVAQVELVPVLVQFTATTTALIPLLQEVVRTQEGRGRGGPR